MSQAREQQEEILDALQVHGVTPIATVMDPDDITGELLITEVRLHWKDVVTLLNLGDA